MRNVLSVYVHNQPGVLVRVASMFSRREFNIDSLAVGVTQSPEYSRITVVIHGDESLVDQMIKQLEKMPDVVAVQRLDKDSQFCFAKTSMIFFKKIFPATSILMNLFCIYN